VIDELMAVATNAMYDARRHVRRSPSGRQPGQKPSRSIASMIVGMPRN
jgi:hypothetical protein